MSLAEVDDILNRVSKVVNSCIQRAVLYEEPSRNSASESSIRVIFRDVSEVNSTELNIKLHAAGFGGCRVLHNNGPLNGGGQLEVIVIRSKVRTPACCYSVMDWKRITVLFVLAFALAFITSNLVTRYYLRNGLPACNQFLSVACAECRVAPSQCRAELTYFLKAISFFFE